MAHRTRHGFVRIAERQTFFHQVIGQVGGGGKAFPRCGAHRLGVDRHAPHHIGVQRQAIQHRIYGIEQRLFVLLVVFVVGQRLGFHQSK